MVEIRLQEPIKAHGEDVDVLRIRRPRGKDFKRISEQSMSTPFRMILDFAAILADVPPSALDDLCAADVGRVMEVVGPFLGESPATGGIS